MSKYDFIKVGQVVYWCDPERLSSGEYKIALVPDEEITDDSIILIASDKSEAEVLPSELIQVNTATASIYITVRLDVTNAKGIKITDDDIQEIVSEIKYSFGNVGDFEIESEICAINEEY